MHTVSIFSPKGEPFQVPKPRVFGLLAQGWTLTAPKKKVEPEYRTRQPKAATAVREEVSETPVAEEK